MVHRQHAVAQLHADDLSLSAAPFPYEELIAQSAARSKREGEFELWDTAALESGFFDIEIEYAKNSIGRYFDSRYRDKLRPGRRRRLHILPTLWFRNTWSWGRDKRRPNLHMGTAELSKVRIIEASHDLLGDYRLYCEDADELLFTENESNAEAALGRSERERRSSKTRSMITWFTVIRTRSIRHAIGTKAAAHYKIDIPPGESRTIRLRLQANYERARQSFRAFANFDDLLYAARAGSRRILRGADAQLA